VIGRQRSKRLNKVTPEIEPFLHRQVLESHTFYGTPPAWKLGFQRIDLTSIGLLPNHPYFRRVEVNGGR
jgi:hypothetical protein